MNLNSFENELISDWINELRYKKEEYMEPILCSDTVNLIKLACTTFNQDIHVFVMSVDIIEDYIRKKELKKEEISENVLVLVTAIFMSSKYMGEQDLKARYIVKFLKKITEKTYSNTSVKLTEIEILTTLDNRLPITTLVDDLNTFVTKYEKECRLRVSIRPLCLDILEALYLTKVQWFYELKSVYIQNEEALKVFQSLMGSRYYLPIGILLYAFEHTNYQYCINIKNIADELSSIMQIHVDHLNTLVSKIDEMVRLN